MGGWRVKRNCPKQVVKTKFAKTFIQRQNQDMLITTHLCSRTILTAVLK